MADETTTQPTPDVQPAPKLRIAPQPASSRIVTLKKFGSDETFQHTLSDAATEFVDIQNPNDKRLTEAQKAIVIEKGVITIPVKKPIAFARDFGYTKNGQPFVSEFTDEWTEDKCPKCGHDLAETVSETADKSQGVRCSACDTVWNP